MTRRGSKNICRQIDADIWSGSRVHTHALTCPHMAKGVFSSSNQSCCHPMAQPARMTLEAGTVRGTHGCQARNSQMGETKGAQVWLAKQSEPSLAAHSPGLSAATNRIPPTSNPTGWRPCRPPPPQVPGR